MLKPMLILLLALPAPVLAAAADEKQREKRVCKREAATGSLVQAKRTCLTKKEWRGRVGWAPTNASFESFVTALRKLRGEDAAKQWLEGMVANDTKTFPNNITIRDAIANGELDVGIINHYYVAEAYASEGRDYPVGLFYPPKGDPGALVNVSGAGILATTKRRPQAEKLVRYLLDQQAQEYFARDTKEYPLAAGVKPDPGLRPLDEIQQPEGLDLSELGDLKTTVELLQDTGAL